MLPEKNVESTSRTEKSHSGNDTEWDGTWGSIAPVPYSIETLCVRIEKEPGKPRIYYYPYRTIGQWNWAMDTIETLEIQVANIQLQITGRGLRRLAEALNLGQLRLVQTVPFAKDDEDMYVRSILIQDLD